jgi:hypothetical protein
MGMDIVMMQHQSIMPKFSFSNKQPHVTLPVSPNNNVSSLTLLKRLRVQNILVFKQDRQCTHHVTVVCVPATTVAMAKKWRITWVCILDLVMQHANQIFSAQQDIVLCVPSGCTIFFTFI